MNPGTPVFSAAPVAAADEAAGAGAFFEASVFAAAGAALAISPPSPRPSRDLGAAMRNYFPPGMKRVCPAWILEGSESLLALMISRAVPPVFLAIEPMLSPF